MHLRELDNRPVTAQETSVPEQAENVKWYVIRSGVLNDRFVLCMRKELYKEVTARFPDTVIYFLPEMEELLALRDDLPAAPGRAAQAGMEREAWCRMVRKVHLTKKTFKGWIIPRKTKGGLQHASGN